MVEGVKIDLALSSLRQSRPDVSPIQTGIQFRVPGHRIRRHTLHGMSSTHRHLPARPATTTRGVSWTIGLSSTGPRRPRKHRSTPRFSNSIVNTPPPPPPPPPPAASRSSHRRIVSSASSSSHRLVRELRASSIRRIVCFQFLATFAGTNIAGRNNYGCGLPQAGVPRRSPVMRSPVCVCLDAARWRAIPGQVLVSRWA